MRKLFFSFLIVFTAIFTLSYSWALSDWILHELDKYPIETYFFEVGKSDGIGEEAYEIATAEAYRNATIRILKQANRIIRLNEDKAAHNMVREHYNAVLDSYCVSLEEAPALKLSKEGFTVRNLSVDLARTDQHTYALIYINREKLKSIYADHALNLRRRIEYRLETAKTAEEDLDIKSAVKIYLQTYPLYEELKEAEIIQIAAQYGHTSNFSAAFEELANAATYTSEDLWTHRQAIKQVEKLQPQTITSLNDIAGVIKSQFLPQRGAFSNKVLIRPLIYADSEIICSFTQEFKEVLQKELGWIHNFTPRRLSSSYWENGDEIIIRTTLRDINTGEFLASAAVRFLNSKLREPLTCKPSNYKQAQIEKETFTPRYYATPSVRRGGVTPTFEKPNEHQFSPVGGLKVEVWTGKGSGPQYYTEGNKVKVFARVNQPAYLRLLYTLANQKRTLLIDNYHIGPSQIDSDVEIDEFLCVPPFGTEFLIVAARTEKFPPIETYEENGYIFLVDQDAESAARSFRGLQRIPDKPNEQFSENNAQESSTFQQSEAQLVLTIIEK